MAVRVREGLNELADLNALMTYQPYKEILPAAFVEGNEEDGEEQTDEQEDVELEDGEEEAEDEHLAEVGSVENNFKIETNDKHTDSRPTHHIMGTSDQLLLRCRGNSEDDQGGLRRKRKLSCIDIH